MNGEREFARALADYLALHTEQPSSYLSHLIHSFLRGVHEHPRLEPQDKNELSKRLKAEMEGNGDVPDFLQNYLLTHLERGEWPPQALFLASRYLRRQPRERFATWPQRRQFVAELDGEPIRGTELGYRQMLYSQGAEAVFRWRGVPCFKSSYDIAIYAMLIEELRPANIIELGSGSGGSALLFADLCASIGIATKIISVDNTIAKVADSRIEFVQADCRAWLKATAESKQTLGKPCLLIEDFHSDLTGFIADLDALLEAGDYLVIEDSYPKQTQISTAIAGRPYFVDVKYTDFFGINCTSAVNSIFVKQTRSRSEPRAPQERQLVREQDRAWRKRSHSETP